MKFLIVGGGARLNPTMLRVRKFLDRARPGELYTTFAISGKCDLSFFYAKSWAREHLAGYHHVYHNVKYWGSPATIKQLKKELAKTSCPPSRK
jgi:hypothetical protein